MCLFVKGICSSAPSFRVHSLVQVPDLCVGALYVAYIRSAGKAASCSRSSQARRPVSSPNSEMTEMTNRNPSLLVDSQVLSSSPPLLLSSFPLPKIEAKYAAADCAGACRCCCLGACRGAMRRKKINANKQQSQHHHGPSSFAPLPFTHVCPSPTPPFLVELKAPKKKSASARSFPAENVNNCEDLFSFWVGLSNTGQHTNCNESHGAYQDLG